MNQQIFTLIEKDYSLITPTSRLSRHLHNTHAENQVSAGKQVWESPLILPWAAWLQYLQRELRPDLENEQYCLNAHQQASLWNRIIRESDYADEILQVASVARQVMQAWELVHQWQLPLFPENIYINQDAYAFQYWAHLYLQRCEENNWIDDARFPDLLMGQLSQGTSCADMKLAFVGFDELYPQQSMLLEKLISCGADIVVYESESKSPLISAYIFQDESDEIETAANWARTMLSSNDQQSIGVIVPGLTQLRNRILEAFDDTLLSENVLHHEEPENRPYSIALGQALNSYPMIVAAFRVLKLLNTDFSLEDVSALILSPWIKGAESERSSRHKLDAALRDYGQKQFSKSQLYQIPLFFEDKVGGCEILFECIRAMEAMSEDFSGSRSSNEWIQKIESLLSVFGWPGERSLNSAEYQTMEAWQDLLLQFSSLEVVLGSLGQSSVFSQMSQLASTYSFQAETAETRLQVLSPGAAAGMHFDHVWMLGMHEDAWPAAMEANPFIPLELQKSHSLPFASAELRLKRGQRLTQSLLHSAEKLVISYAAFDGDRQLRPSPSLRHHFDDASSTDIERQQPYASQLYSSSRLEFLKDQIGTPLPDGEFARGGSGLFKDQAACPFRAFARHRLHSHGLNEPDIGLTAAERGMLVHEILQDLFSKIGSHSELENIQEQEKKDFVGQSVHSIMEKYRRQWPYVFTPGFTDIESKRLKAIIFEWLELEKNRAPFRVIATEQKQAIQFANIEINTRVDRIDQLEDGRLVLIDYKTGMVTPSAWFGDRPDDPQLPLYAITQERDVAALVFGKLTSAESKYSGVATDGELIPGVKGFHDNRLIQDTAWEDIIENWRRVLNELGDAFRRGEAEVDPKNASTCRYCDLHGFCRISEQDYRLNDEESH